MIGEKTTAMTTVTAHAELDPSAAITVTASTISGIARTASITRLTVSSAIPLK